MTPLAPVTPHDADLILGRLFPVPTSDDLNELRAATLGCLVALAGIHKLKLPREIQGAVISDTLRLDLHFEQDDQVDGWAKVLGLDAAQDKDTGKGTTWREASRHNWTSPVWLSWQSIYVRCYQFHREPTQEQVAAAVLQSDLEPSR